MNYPIETLADEFSILRFAPDAPVPPYVLETRVWSVTRTDRELSVLCTTACIPASYPQSEQPLDGEYQRVDNYRGLRIAGALDFSEVGVLADLTRVIATVNISVLTLSTFDTDYIFVQQRDFKTTLETLATHGCQLAALPD